MWNGMLHPLASMAFPNFRSIIFTATVEDATLVIWFMTSAQEGLPHVVPQSTGMLGVTGPGSILSAEPSSPAVPCGALPWVCSILLNRGTDKLQFPEVNVTGNSHKEMNGFIIHPLILVARPQSHSRLQPETLKAFSISLRCCSQSFVVNGERPLSWVSP